jgi:uncharacterized protein (TIGR00251 family)
VIHSTPQGVALDVRVIPRAKKTEVAGTRDGALLVRLNAPPVEGAANDALIAFLAELFHTPRSSLRIVSGERGRRKRVTIAGVTSDRVRDILDACLRTS